MDIGQTNASDAHDITSFRPNLFRLEKYITVAGDSQDTTQTPTQTSTQTPNMSREF